MYLNLQHLRLKKIAPCLMLFITKKSQQEAFTKIVNSKKI